MPACRITLASSLGTLAKPVTIDGYTEPGSSSNTLATDATGLQPIANGNFGVSAIQRSGATIASILIGGEAAGARKVIAASGGLVPLGAAIEASGVSNLAIQGNDIGVGSDETTIMGNGGPGIRIDRSTALVGGTNAGEGNVIADNRTGIAVIGASTATIVGNSIAQNDAPKRFSGPRPIHRATRRNSPHA